MDTTITEVPTIAGTPFAGGFYAGRILIAGVAHAVVVAPKAEGEHKESGWSRDTRKTVTSALSFYDGLANTEAMAAAGSELAKWARDLRIAGFDDWYIPSRDELEIIYRALKPTDEENYVRRNGDNPSSLPPGHPYFEDSPAQTQAEAFKDSGAEAFADDWYWTSTQCAGYESYAWCQLFSYGGQLTSRKDTKLRARAVRRVRI